METVIKNEVDFKSLRVGNWINGIDSGEPYNSKPKPFRVESISEEMINARRVEGFDTDSASQLSNIDITTDLLMWIGFKKEGDVYSFQFDESEDDFYIEFYHSGNRFFILCGNYFYGKPVYYLHSLQNWFFLFSGGKELEINL